MTISKRDRYRGALVGVLAGDALGAPYETWKADAIAKDMEHRGGLMPFDYPNPWAKTEPPSMFEAGRPTDDSDHTAALAESLIALRGLSPEDLLIRLRHVVFDHVSPLWSGKAFGAGGTTRDTLSGDPIRVARGRANTIGTNGSLMRSVPMALWLHGKFSHIRVFNDATKMFHHPSELIFMMSDVTHTHPHAKDACWMYSNILDSILSGEDFTPHTSARITSLEHRVRLRLDDAYDFPVDPGAWPARGAAEFSLYAALWCDKHATSFADGIEKAVRIGGDTDTYAAIAGGLLGARYGIDAIPSEWQKVLKGQGKMIEYADALYDMAHEE